MVALAFFDDAKLLFSEKPENSDELKAIKAGLEFHKRTIYNM